MPQTKIAVSLCALILVSMIIRYLHLFVFMVTVFLGSAAAQTEEDQSFYIDRYFSVSYPLHHMKENSPYGWRTDPFTGKRKFHNGIDYACKKEPVLAMFDGVIEEVGYNKHSGNYVRLQCGTYLISYCHLSKCLIQRGESVFCGDTLAISGNSGQSVGPHLHLSIKYKGHYINPQKLIDYVREVRRECFEALDIEPNTNLSPKDFIKKHLLLAQKYSKIYGIPTSVILSQMAYESAWGGSRLCRHGRNYFGIKATKKWIESGKPYSIHSDDKPNDAFCNYPSTEASMKHYAELVTSKRYNQCKKYGNKDYKRWLLTLQKKGYATNPHYAEHCIAIINKYCLYEYDDT